VDVQPINLGQELGEAIELGLEAPPVVAALPVVDQRSGVLYANPLRPVAQRTRRGPNSSPASGRWRTATECCWRCAVASTARRSTACSGQSMSSSPTS